MNRIVHSSDTFYSMSETKAQKILTRALKTVSLSCLFINKPNDTNIDNYLLLPNTYNFTTFLK